MSTQKINVEVEERSDRGKNVCGRLRRAGKVPGNVYGLDIAPVAVSVTSRAIGDVLRSGAGQNAILTLKAGDGRARDVMIRELQRHPMTGAVTHVDFKRVDLSLKLEVAVPLHLTGVPLGVKNDGGVLDFIHREVLVNCLPTAIPEQIDVDVESLQIGQHIEIKDLPELEGVEYNEDLETVIAVVAAARAEEEETTEEDEDAPESSEEESEESDDESEAKTE